MSPGGRSPGKRTRSGRIRRRSKSSRPPAEASPGEGRNSERNAAGASAPEGGARASGAKAIQRKARTVGLIDASVLEERAQDGLDLPEVRDPQVRVLDEEAGECEYAHRSSIVDTKFYVDNGLEFVDPRGDPWTLRVEKLVFINSFGASIEVPWADIQFGSGARATSFEKSYGLYYPLKDDLTTRAFDSENTPNIVRAARLVFEVIAELQAQRVEYADLTAIFSIAIASLGTARTLVNSYRGSQHRSGASRRTGRSSDAENEGGGASKGTINKGLAGRGVRPPPGTRVRPRGVPSSWRAKSAKGEGGVRYVDPKNPHNSVRVMPGKANSPYPNSRGPYVRWIRNGQSLDVNGNVVPKNSSDAHIPLADFHYIP